ncbi:pseudouridine synthase [Limnovirga soli]|uniref:Pseudouridine synthase n=1 Tax=Limnovirga soli TaxID=2656915 RepID=A0A8J8FDG2_9BACT|nr:pseudouridine synthase [Limnovirga soli]NNV54667.1 pseudouridine synthase [Limnovirga soli]
MAKAFDKFINKEVTGAKKKEAFRQEKKKFKKELRQKADEERVQNLEKYRLIVNTPAANKSREVVAKAPEKAAPKKSFTVNARDAQSASDAPKKRTPSRTTDKPAAKYKAGKPVKQTYEQITQKPVSADKDGAEEVMPLNKFIAHAGICGRREAAELVKEGKVQVNGSIIFEPGFKVTGKEKILVKGEQVFVQKNLVYILLNKPKDYITTAKDPEGRKTVLDLLKGATKERIYPVGRLDRNTTGVLLLTNDGEMAQKLTHPSFEIKKIYEVRLDKPVTKKDFDAILSGITLEDGFVSADSLAYADAKDKSVVGIEIHSGRNRIVRRIFEHLGYDVKNLDRVMFANLTKKNVDRGKWRLLNDKEVRLLKFMNKSFVRAAKETK